MNCDIFELFYENCVNVQGPQNIGKVRGLILIYSCLQGVKTMDFKGN